MRSKSDFTLKTHQCSLGLVASKKLQALSSSKSLTSKRFQTEISPSDQLDSNFYPTLLNDWLCLFGVAELVDQLVEEPKSAFKDHQR